MSGKDNKKQGQELGDRRNIIICRNIDWWRIQFCGLSRRRALKRSTNEGVDYEILHLFQEERIKKSFFNVTQNFLARGSTNLSKSVQRNFKQNIILSNESCTKSKTNDEKPAAWLQKVIQSGTRKLIPFLVILIPTLTN